MVSLREGKAEEAEAYALEALAADSKSAYAHDVLGLTHATQGRFAAALESLGKAFRLAPKEEFIRKHYLQVRDLYIGSSRLEEIQKEEKTNE
jgi:tetratricopeptide (TPR) repeat protein